MLQQNTTTFLPGGSNFRDQPARVMSDGHWALNLDPADTALLVTAVRAELLSRYFHLDRMSVWELTNILVNFDASNQPGFSWPDLPSDLGGAYAVSADEANGAGDDPGQPPAPTAERVSGPETSESQQAKAYTFWIAPVDGVKFAFAYGGRGTVNLYERDLTEARLEYVLQAVPAFSHGADVQVKGAGTEADPFIVTLAHVDTEGKLSVSGNAKFEASPGYFGPPQQADDDDGDAALQAQLTLANTSAVKSDDGGQAQRQAALDDGDLGNVDAGELDSLTLPGEASKWGLYWNPGDAGAYQLRFGDETTANLRPSAGSVAIDAALEALDDIQAAKVTGEPGAWTLTITADAGHPLQAVDVVNGIAFDSNLQLDYLGA